ncbi:hypothetical protein HNR42_000700 [Deinobacterium chartae]|uniref:Integral membrane protein n=1 Tax=Deinobacterium chartae TaxID=521158 RepID=A0A841HWI9_9DEIO|nr:hypothetical protein [Deinobacterium chartae]MBB6097286.1 hypothetical protein [Deinobacterium chartae]
MSEFVSEYKWALFAVMEGFFWLMLLAALISRYWFGLHRLSLVFVGAFVLNDLGLLLLAYLDYRETGEFSTYQIVMLAIVLYALTLGKGDFNKLDAWAKRTVARLKGQAAPTDTAAPRRLSGREHARAERQGFIKHLAVFAVVQGLLWIAVGVLPDSELLLNLKRAAAIWTVLLVVDFIISFSYTLFPRR